MTLLRSTVECVFGTLKHWMGTTHLLIKTLAHVGTEMSLEVTGLQAQAGNADSGHREGATGDATVRGESLFMSLCRHARPQQR